MIETYGHIPNGNRTYYLSRSQPPVFALMVELFEEDGVRGARRYLDHLKLEHAFWMDGAESLIPNQAYRHVVRMPDGSLLNRYWDDRDTPRDESSARRCRNREAFRSPAERGLSRPARRRGFRLGLLQPLAARYHQSLRVSAPPSLFPSTSTLFCLSWKIPSPIFPA